MASVSAACIRLGTPSEFSVRTNNKINGLNSSLVSLGWISNKPFPSMRTSRLHVCAAKPETLEKVSGIVRKQLALTPETQVTPETKFAELGADSLDTVEIVMELEEGFDITLDDENAEKISTIQEAADLIDKLVEAKA